MPRKVECHSPKLEAIPTTVDRSTFGVVEIMRGCGCQFCSIALRKGKSLPLEHILENVRRNVAGGADMTTFTTEDIFLYEQGPKFQTNIPALKRLFESVAAVERVKYIALTHGAIAPVVQTPEVIEELSEIAVGMAPYQHRLSIHSDKRFQTLFVGLATGSPRLFNQFMKGKAYPYSAAQWTDVVLKGMEILNKHNCFPFNTVIIGLPGETDEDTKATLDLVHALKGMKGVIVPTLFTPLEDTQLERTDSQKLVTMTDLQWELFFTCWRYNIDFYRDSPSFRRKFNMGVPIYYYALGRRLFGKAVKYPLLRLGHFPERFLRCKLYLDLSRTPRYRVPERVEVPKERFRPLMPVTVE